MSRRIKTADGRRRTAVDGPRPESLSFDAVFLSGACDDPHPCVALSDESVPHALALESVGPTARCHCSTIDVDQSRCFRGEGAPGVEQIVRSLSIRAEARVLGRSFQGHAAVRQITEEDHQMLREAARDLPLEPRARILPEEKLEAALIMDDRSAVEELVRDESPGGAEERKQYLYEDAPRRNPDLVNRLQHLYDGHCQVCWWNPVDEYGEPLCEGHHVQWLSRGGDDALDNLMLVCPNHHRAIHRCDAPLDWGDMAYDFGDHREAVATDRHLT